MIRHDFIVPFCLLNKTSHIKEIIADIIIDAYSNNLCLRGFNFSDLYWR